MFPLKKICLGKLQTKKYPKMLYSNALRGFRVVDVGVVEIKDMKFLK